MSKNQNAKLNRTSLYLPPHFQQALKVIRKEEKVFASNQIQMGLMMYFERHRKLLEKNKIHLWQNKK